MKNPAYPDTLYVTELVARGTVNTMPGKTLDAVADHGDVVGDTVTGTYDEARGRARRARGAGHRPSTTSSPSWRTRAWRSSIAAWTELLATVSDELALARPRRRLVREASFSSDALPLTASGSTRCATRATSGCRGSPGPAAW